LALSRGTSNGADWRDVVGNMVAFEAINGVRLEVRMTTGDHQGKADLKLSILAHRIGQEIGEAAPLASVSLTTSATHLRTMEAALIHGLYMLDGQLASGEFAKILDG